MIKGQRLKVSRWRPSTAPTLQSPGPLRRPQSVRTPALAEAGAASSLEDTDASAGFWSCVDQALKTHCKDLQSLFKVVFTAHTQTFTFSHICYINNHDSSDICILTMQEQHPVKAPVCGHVLYSSVNANVDISLTGLAEGI